MRSNRQAISRGLSEWQWNREAGWHHISLVSKLLTYIWHQAEKMFAIPDLGWKLKPFTYVLATDNISSLDSSIYNPQRWSYYT
jgi:hypothetical protein